ncbi:hypothetical protein B0F90DRAFT_1151267 [Multifurca ochricompacta]|uniref:Uncharacterized protein n=1 Tax=Multifurca ochricompacta TaxID=376703 RepID=A0AAD4M0C4_9AGAM|nr:hypothetical protein B0F90DRAFT_1151267 [Multifurca ochricompacta]
MKWGSAGRIPTTKLPLPIAVTGRRHLRKSSEKRSYCPSIIVAIAGPWMCVTGAIYLERVVVQPLTDYVWLGFNPLDEEKKQLDSILKLFFALKSSISTLQEYYRQLLPTPSTEFPPQGLHPFPYVQNFASQSLVYLSRIDSDNVSNLLYKAELGPSRRPVVVKFASTYDAEAHRLLAAYQLAPFLPSLL